MSVGNLRDKLDGNEIDLALSNLTTVPVAQLAEVPESTRLDLSSNHFVTLPAAFCQLSHVVWLDLSKNRLLELPRDFGLLVSLEHLDLLGNQLRTLPPSFGQLRRLQWLDLKGNPLDLELSKRAGDCNGAAQCRACARNVIHFLRKEPETNEEEANRWSRALLCRRWLVRMPAVLAVGLTLFVLTFFCAGKRK